MALKSIFYTFLLTLVLSASFIITRPLAVSTHARQQTHKNTGIFSHTKKTTSGYRSERILSLSTNPNDLDVIVEKPKSRKIKRKIALGLFSITAVVLGYLYSTGSLNGINVQDILQDSVTKIEGLGPYGPLYFAVVYIVAEVLAIPALPLTASSGYLFGLVPGVITVLISATIAASISFFIGRTLLRGWAKKIADGNAKWRALDSVIGKEGFKVVLLLRLSPLLPFAISNYLYGVTAVDFGSYFVASLIGFIPGTTGIVYAGSAGKEILATVGHGTVPWYLYVGAGVAIIIAAKFIGKIASDTIEAMETEAEKDKAQAELMGTSNSTSSH
mmetsp:Transcript_34662/g.35352  ORF Transcript_34662/g.35352 Transcript_34662/m.35352 type:complete len:330 (+) Transcript_34662:105-1094(+)|eukprot:CAMPEP_0182419730 /NCGR_PEP_ID=MMETSP1167-20130531/4116_1 /TAXON_ID=2988 /ORGANISM="Mallomonas Sp, Strain CCMP3275" /LENGTH=329 /DNA_ID=CAMNT_0024594801 /DNA_START=95 /DNA_END=1084 /DNA_ORIENTATION=-